MTTYTAIPDADIDTDSPITQSLMTLMRDNPIAVTEGATGAPRIVRGAFDNAVLHKWLYDYGDGSDGAVSWSGTTTKAPGLYQATTFEVAASASITMTMRGIWIICAQTSITINNGATLSANSMGAPGAITDSTSYDHGGNGLWGGSGGGGGQGGDGGSTLYTAGGAGGNPGTAGAAQSAQIEAMLLATAPMVNQNLSSNIYDGTQQWITTNFGAAEIFDDGRQWLGGGGAGAGGSGEDGGDGGGVIILVAPTVTIGTSAVVSANGGNGVAGGTFASGGGGGGAVIIATPSGGLTNNGTVSATGGTGGNSTYDGGNGGAGITAEITL